jgi:hypothetical protein
MDMIVGFEIYIIYCITLVAMIIFSMRMGVDRMSVRDALGELGLVGLPACCAKGSGALASLLGSDRLPVTSLGLRLLLKNRSSDTVCLIKPPDPTTWNEYHLSARL